VGCLRRGLAGQPSRSSGCVLVAGWHSGVAGCVSCSVRLPYARVHARRRVPSELKKQIMAARLAKKLTQAQLAQVINEKPQVIQEYESGKAIPSPQILSKLSRALGTTLSAKKAAAKK
jgi:ribosome-binding protein aMBF1 (putative translation factor)